MLPSLLDNISQLHNVESRLVQCNNLLLLTLHYTALSQYLVMFITEYIALSDLPTITHYA